MSLKLGLAGLLAVIVLVMHQGLTQVGEPLGRARMALCGKGRGRLQVLAGPFLFVA